MDHFLKSNKTPPRSSKVWLLILIKVMPTPLKSASLSEKHPDQNLKNITSIKKVAQILILLPTPPYLDSGPKIRLVRPLHKKLSNLNITSDTTAITF